MAPRSRSVEPDESESESDARSNVNGIFSDTGSDSESNSNLELDSEALDDDGCSGEGLLGDEGQMPPERYLAEAEGLGVSQLRQKWYSDGTQEKLDETRVYRNRYCRHISVDPVQHWKWIYCMVSSALGAIFGVESVSGLSKNTIVKVKDVIAIVAERIVLELTQRPKKNMYIEDVAEFARVLLTTTEMTFDCGWQRIQILFFTQLGAITASRPKALLDLRYKDMVLTLIQYPEGGRPRLFIFLKSEFTKKFLRKKAPNEFKIPEITFDPTLVLSPHVCLLGMLFYIKGFKTLSTMGPVLDSPERLYSLGAVRETMGYRIALETQLTVSTVRSWMRRVGEITGFEQVIKPYLLRYTGAKAFNSNEVTDALQNAMLQHAGIRKFIRHYEVDVDVDVQGIVRKTGSQSHLVRLACSLSASIHPNRPYRLSTEESKSLNDTRGVRARQDTVTERRRKWEDRNAKWERTNLAFQDAFGQLGEKALSKHHNRLLEKLELFEDRMLEAKARYNKAVRELRNEKQRQRNWRIRENLERYKNEQPVIDLERQLAGNLVDTKVAGTLENKRFMPPEHLMVIDTMLTLPGATLEAEYPRRINAINAVTAFCAVEEGRPTRRSLNLPAICIRRWRL
ncbi:DUF3435 domain-containing protein [Aspergillus tanneri]|uniref:Uncharacterized protein n=1 Tax=Aspergillus tanneri TaxID=1220188 RepID=A0A5M9M450_9EURO|nr:uncharacterized protein ATNIH1004_010731 [Aspergillus tanneri]KAA8641792.1 hypothetical protein ATNIH1004_010731 [Aspergillus tanneri]